jgi:hypothetical protein
MPQTLEDTDYPGSSPKIALGISGYGTTAIIAPLYTTEQLDRARELAQGLGFKVYSTTYIHSLADLERVAETTPPNTPPDLQYHQPGCIFTGQTHPGDCYVQSDGGIPDADRLT